MAAFVCQELHAVGYFYLYLGLQGKMKDTVKLEEIHRCTTASSALATKINEAFMNNIDRLLLYLQIDSTYTGTYLYC